jgi:hypothetical protein
MATVNDLASTNVWTFISAFAVYFVLLIMTIISGKEYTMTNIYSWMIIFVVITFFIQTASNAYLTSRKEICGNTDIGIAISSTIYPWIFIYGIILIFIFFIPGWIRLFSNTFGLYFANAWGLKELLGATIFKVEYKNQDEQYQLINTINMVYNDPSLLINELDPFKIDIQRNPVNNELISVKWESLSRLLNSGLFISGITIDNESILKLHNMMILKETVGVSTWLFLGGIIAVLISTNTLLSSKCKQSMTTKYKTIFKE